MPVLPMQAKIHFIFDLDGTVTAAETLPMIGRHFHMEKDIAAMTSEAVRGSVPYMENFIRRVNILGGLPVDEVAALLAGAPIHRRLLDFIIRHASICSIATTNLDCWIAGLMERIPCQFFCSHAEIQANRVARLCSILKKETVARRYREKGMRTVFIGDGYNDMEAMREADLAIASGLTHQPAAGALSVADYLCCEETALCRLLEQLC